MQREVIEVELSPEERLLILRYGYPFDRIKQAIEACQKSRTIEIVSLDAFELERLIGDLSKSINDMAGGALQNALLASANGSKQPNGMAAECSTSFEITRTGVSTLPDLRSPAARVASR